MALKKDQHVNSGLQLHILDWDLILTRVHG